MKQNKHVGKRLLAGLLGAVLLQTAVSIPSGLQASAADEVEYNYAKALQYSIYFYDGNMCGTEVAENNRYQWRGNCHTYDAQVPLQPMGEDNGGSNLSLSFIDQYRDILDPDGDGHAMLIGTADEKHVFLLQTKVTHVNVRRNIHPCQMTDVHRTVGVWQSRRDGRSLEILFHFLYSAYLYLTHSVLH